MNNERYKESGLYQKPSQEIALLKTQDSTAIMRLERDDSNGKSVRAMLLIDICTLGLLGSFSPERPRTKLVVV